MARKGTPSKRYRHATRGAKVKGTKHLEKLHIKKDDLVIVLSGDDRGTRGKVMRTIPSEGMVVVEGVNRKWKHLRRSQENPQGGRVEREFPFPACKVRRVEG
ncbi:MAG: 50S ribosomal protein L24 [Planctomycetota bacterium]